MMESFGLSVRHAMNQVVLRTTMGGAQPMAAALDHEGWSEVLGTIAGDDTVLVICPDVKRAHDVERDWERCWSHDEVSANSGYGCDWIRRRGTGSAAAASPSIERQAPCLPAGWMKRMRHEAVFR